MLPKADRIAVVHDPTVNRFGDDSLGAGDQQSGGLLTNAQGRFTIRLDPGTYSIVSTATRATHICIHTNTRPPSR